MPLFEYICQKCKNEFELLVNTSTVPECPQCKSQELTKKLSVFATTSGGKEKEAPSLPCKSTCGHGSCPYDH